MNAPLPIPFSAEERLLTNSVVTTYDIASLAFIKDLDPELALKLATESGKQSDRRQK